MPRYLRSVDEAKETTFCANVRNVMSAVETWRIDNGTMNYPSTDTLNDDIIKSPNYFSQPPKNPFTNEILQAQKGEPNADGQFQYVLHEGTATSYTIATKPDCGLNTTQAPNNPPENEGEGG